MKFTTKISGIRVDDCNVKPLFGGQIITLAECLEKVKRQETMNFLLDNLRFSICENGEWMAIIDYDTNYKLSILESYPEYEQELVKTIGENWINHYLRFGH